ncbi:MAG: PAS domain S-box protein [bacterium]|nr:PAS domain S-box protein [bacterium]
MHSKTTNNARLFLINDLLEKFLTQADNPAELSDFITKEIKELICAKIIVLYKYSYNKKNNFDSLSFTPNRYSNLANSSEFIKLIKAIKNYDKLTLIEPHTSSSKAGKILRNLNFNDSIVLPLNISGENIGFMLLLDLFSTEGIEIIKGVLTSLSTVLALLVKNINFYQNLESLVTERTSEIERINKKLKNEIEEKTKVQNKLADEKSYIESIISSMADGLWVIDKEGNNKYINPSMSNMLNYNREEFFKLTPLDITSEKYSTSTLNNINSALNGNIASDELSLIAKNGNKIPVSVVSSPIRNHEGSVTCAFAVIRDITKRLESEKLLKKSFEDMITIISNATEKRDPYTAGHQKRVAQLSVALAKKLHLDKKTIECLYYGSIIHDIGKLYIPSDILNKPGKLSNSEFSIIKEHPRMGFEIIENVNFIWPIKELVLHHHEKLDGSGYPDGLKGKKIDITCRIAIVADVVEAMISHRPYRPALDKEQALKEISDHKASQYDPKVVDACIELFEKDDFKFEDPNSYNFSAI